MTDTKQLVVFEILKRDGKPFKPRQVREPIGISTAHMTYYLNDLVSKGILIKQGGYYVAPSSSLLANYLEGSESKKLEIPSRFKGVERDEISKGCAARNSGDIQTYLKVKEQLEDALEDYKLALKYLINKKLTEEKAQAMLEAKSEGRNLKAVPKAEQENELDLWTCPKCKGTMIVGARRYHQEETAGIMGCENIQAKGRKYLAVED